MNLKKTKVMVSRLKDEALKSKVDSCAMSGKRVIAYLMMVILTFSVGNSRNKNLPSKQLLY